MVERVSTSPEIYTLKREKERKKEAEQQFIINIIIYDYVHFFFLNL